MEKRKHKTDRIWDFLQDESGIGVIEVISILVVLIGLVLIFKKQLTTLMVNIFKEITKQSKEVY